MERRPVPPETAKQNPLASSTYHRDADVTRVFAHPPKHNQPLAYALVKALLPGLAMSEDLAKIFETGYISVPSEVVTGDDLRSKVISEEYAALNKILLEKRKDFMYEYQCPEAIVDDMIKRLQADKFKVTTKSTSSPREPTDKPSRTLVIKW